MSAPEKPSRRKSFASPPSVYMPRAELAALLAAAARVVAAETEVARNSYSLPKRRRGQALRQDWKAGDPEHFELVDSLRQALFPRVTFWCEEMGLWTAEEGVADE